MEYAVIFLPLVGSILGFLGKSLIKYFSEITTSLFVSISAVFSIICFGMEFKIIHTEILKYLNGSAQEILLLIGQ